MFSLFVKYDIPVLYHRPYSLDLTLRGFFLSVKVKLASKVIRFDKVQTEKKTSDGDHEYAF